MNQGTMFLTLPDRKLAYQQRRGTCGKLNQAGIVFLGGFASDMQGTKALFLDSQCQDAGIDYLRFDYRGHGESSDSFEDGTIGDWFDDALKVFDALTQGPQILVGSSMGGWIGLMLARARPERVAGFVGIAAAPDFTEEMIRPSLTPRQAQELQEAGRTYEEDAPPDHRIPITKKLMDEAQQHQILHGPLGISCPVHLIQGQQDRSVPWRHALKIADALTGADVRITLVKDGDHRLSRDQDLALLWDIARPLAQKQG